MTVLLPRTEMIIETGRNEGLHIGAELYVSRGGQCVFDNAWGEARPGTPMKTDTLMLWLSSGKPLIAVAILKQCERGLCALDDPVARYLPAFAAGGKDQITIRHLLTHTGGFRWIDTGWPEASWDETIANISKARIEHDWIPGKKAGYHPYTSWYILGELVQRLSGRRLRDYVREEICVPLGMHDTWLGMSAEQYRTYGNRIAPMQNTVRPDLPPHKWSSREGVQHGSPGGGAFGPIRELGYFYEMLSGGGERNGVRVLQAEGVAQMVGRQRTNMVDDTFKQPIDWGLGLLLDSKQYEDVTLPYGYGRYASAGTFGHSGSQSSVGMCDPAYDLVIALAFNGMPGEARHQRRVRTALESIYLDLGLANETANEAT